MLRRLAAFTFLFLAPASPGEAQTSQTTTQGQILAGNSTGALIPVSPFSCYVDGTAITNISTCVGILNPGSGALFGGVITSNTPEHIMTLPWNPGTFTGVLKLGRGSGTVGSGNSCGAGPPPNCWLTDVPIIIGSGMSIEGSGKVPGPDSSNNTYFGSGTAIAPSSNFPPPLGSPTITSATCGGSSGSLAMGNYRVEVVEVNNLDSYSGSGGMAVPGFSAVSTETGLIPCPANGTILVTMPAVSGSGSFIAKDFRVFVTPVNGASGTETLQIPATGFMTCSNTASVDTVYACGLSTSATTASVLQLTSGGDYPNLVDLSNPLVVEIGPVIGSGTNTQNEGFWAVLKNLTLALPTGTNTYNPNVAFWNPSDQENSGINNVGLTGQVGSGSSAPAAWIYIGNHAPNSFVSDFQSDTGPASGTVYGMILDGRPGFGTAAGTARVVYNSTFTPGRCQTCGSTISAGALVMGSQAYVDFVDDHFEVPPSQTTDCIEVVDGANVSAQGNSHVCNPFIHLYSTSTIPPGTGGKDIAVRNVTTGGTAVVVQDDANGPTLKTHVSEYATSITAGGTLTMPAKAGLTISSPPAGGIGFDTTGKNYHGNSNGADAIFGVFTSVPTTGNCVKASVASGNVQLADALAPCGTVTTTGSPMNGNLAQFSGTTSITNGNLSGDCTTSNALATTCTKTNGVAFAPSATTDTTNASNISSGTLNIAQMPTTNWWVLPMSGSTNSAAAGAANTMYIWSFIITGIPVATGHLVFMTNTVDNSNPESFGVYDTNGNLDASIAATEYGSGAHTVAWTQGTVTLNPGRYYFGFTAAGTTYRYVAVPAQVTPACAVSKGSTTGGNVLTGSPAFSPPADAWANGCGTMPMFALVP